MAMPRCDRDGGCTYSKAMNQPRPRQCITCGNPEQTGAGTPERAAETAALHAKDRAVAELEAATIALRDAALAGKAAQARYQAALQAFNRAVAPDPEAK